MPSPFNVKGEVILRNDLTFKVKPEDISENPLTICVNVTLHKYLRTNIVFNQASETSPESGGGTGSQRSEGPFGPGKEDAATWDRMEPL